jgi:hypothetical protein
MQSPLAEILTTDCCEFMKPFGYYHADTPEWIPQPLRDELKYHLQYDENQVVLVPYHETPESDEVFNYSMQLCHWNLQILELHDTAKAGDLNCTFLNCKYSIPILLFTFKTE